MSRFFSPRLSGLAPYTPGEQPRRQNVIKLNTNENPYPPSPAVLDAVNRGEVEKLRLYPDPTAATLCDALAARFNLSPAQVMVTNGSDDALAFAFAAFYTDGAPVRFPDITYGFYPVFARLFGCTYEEIPLREDFSVDIESFMQNTGVVLANPNAPSGLALPAREIEKIARANPDRVVLVDEAYADFAEEGCSALPLLDRFENLLIVGTFSKSYSLAGARLGFALGSKELIADLQTVRNSFNPYSINRLTLLAGVAALGDRAYHASCVERIKATRARLTSALRGMGFFVIESSANFVFARHGQFSGASLYALLREKNILVRHFDRPRTGDFIRITVGTDEETDALTGALKSIIGGNTNAQG